MAEFDAPLAKAAVLTHEARMADLIETMKFDPLEGIPLVERHLTRMRDSAAALGFAFDRHAARNELQAATFRLRAGAAVRLLLARSGALAIEVAPLPAGAARPLRVAIRPLPVARDDWRLRHRSSDRAFYDTARRDSGADEVVFAAPDGRLTEGSFTSLFVPRGDTLLTPADEGLLPGVLRAALIEEGRAVPGDVTIADLADGFLLGNAVCGLMPAVLVDAAG